VLAQTRASVAQRISASLGAPGTLAQCGRAQIGEERWF
jgi:hypothetical protein